MEKICVGQIWEITTENFKSTSKDLINGRKMFTILKKNEIIEIRYPYEWHYRTIDNLYFHSTPTEILKNCKLYGKIFPNVRFGNKANLEEILRLKLYDKV